MVVGNWSLVVVVVAWQALVAFVVLDLLSPVVENSEEAKLEAEVEQNDDGPEDSNDAVDVVEARVPHAILDEGGADVVDDILHITEAQPEDEGNKSDHGHGKVEQEQVVADVVGLLLENGAAKGKGRHAVEDSVPPLTPVARLDEHEDLAHHDDEDGHDHGEAATALVRLFCVANAAHFILFS